MPLDQFLQRSRATAAFKQAVEAFQRGGQSNDRIRFDGYAPPVKVARTLTKLLESHPEWEIEGVELRATSGCEYFRGELSVFTADEEHHVRFHWDCRWKAAQVGWTDYFGYPDQIRAAQEFGYDCFRDWEAVARSRAA